jgi:hypothetical protein
MSDEFPRRKRRWPRVLAVLALLALLVVAIGPSVAASAVRRALVGTIEDGYFATAAVDELDVGYSGSLHLAGLAVDDLEGRPVLRLASLDAAVAPLAALGGALDADVTVTGLELHLRQDADGEWNVTGLGRETEEERARREREARDRERETGGELPDARLTFALRDARLVVHGAEGASELTGIEVDVALDGLDRPARVEVRSGLAGPGGPAGAVELLADVTLAPAGELDGSELRAEGTVALTGVVLDSLAPLLVQLAPLRDVAGAVEGELEFAVESGLALRASGALKVSDLELLGPREGATPARIADIALGLEATSDGDGESTHHLSLLCDDFLEVKLDGHTADLGTDAAEVAGSLVVHAVLGEVAELARGFVALREEVTVGGGFVTRVGYEVRAGEDDTMVALDVVGAEVTSFAATDARGAPIDLGGFTHAKLSGKVALGTGTGSVELTEGRLYAGPITGSAELHATGVPGLVAEDSVRALAVEDSKLTLRADLDRLATALTGLLELPALDLAGQLDVDVAAAQAGDVIDVTSLVSATGLRLTAEALDAPLAPGDVTVRSVLRYGSAADDLLIERCELRGDALQADLTGSVSALTADAGQRLSAKLRMNGALGELVGAPAFATAMSGRDLTGALTADVELSGDLERVTAQAQLAVEELRLEVAPALGEAEEPAEPFVLEDPRASVDLAGAWTAVDGALSIERLDLASRFARGDATCVLTHPALGADGVARVSGLRADLAYVPDELGALLGPWLPGELSGATEERCHVEFDGELADFQPFSVLAAASGKASIGLGRFVTSGFDTGGTLDVELADGAASWSGDLSANGGALVLTGNAALAERTDGEPARSELHVQATDLGLTTGLAPLLGKVHPILASMESMQGDLDGVVTAKLDLGYDGVLDPETLAGGWATLDKTRISGAGSLAIDGASLAGSPLFGELLKVLGVKDTSAFELAPVEFSIEDGRVRYAKPWTWSIAGTETTFDGTIGLDETLQLDWSVPVNDALVKKHAYLRYFQGETLHFPLTGTVTKPKLDWKGVLSDLSKTALKRGLTDSLGVGDLVKPPGGDAKEPEDGEPKTAAALLKQADALWTAGQRTEAAELYRRIRDDHKLSLEWLLNADKIKRRIKRAKQPKDG